VTVPDYPDWQTPQAHADQIARTGVPLLAAAATLVKGTAVAVPAGAIQQSAVLPVTQTGYAASISAMMPGTATNPFLLIRLTWSDAASALVVDEETYIIPCATSPSSWVTLGSGIAKGDQVVLTIQSLESVQTATVSYVLNQDSVTRHGNDWYSRNNVNMNVAVPTFTVAQLPSDEAVLGIMHNTTLAASSSVTQLLTMAPGRLCQLAGVLTTVAPSAVQIQVSAVPTSVYTTVAYQLFETPSVAAFYFTFLAPRAPMTIKFANSSTVAGNINCMVSRQAGP